MPIAKRNRKANDFQILSETSRKKVFVNLTLRKILNSKMTKNESRSESESSRTTANTNANLNWMQRLIAYRTRIQRRWKKMTRKRKMIESASETKTGSEMMYETAT
jgi:hypothetical protein